MDNQTNRAGFGASERSGQGGGGGVGRQGDGRLLFSITIDFAQDMRAPVARY